MQLLKNKFLQIRLLCLKRIEERIIKEIEVVTLVENFIKNLCLGHKQHVTILRIDKIEHNIEENVLEKAVSLV